LPTYSLTSTHAFPLRVSAGEFSIGVMKENFQKMLETKADHLRTATQVVAGCDLAIRIRVAEGQAPAPKVAAPARTAAPSRQEESHDYPEARSAQSGAAPGLPDRSASQANSAEPQTSSAGSSNPAEPNSEEKLDSSTVKEAYKLFEGPGSRRIN
jgi:hypothetical protein